jgi:hypothetical protein
MTKRTDRITRSAGEQRLVSGLRDATPEKSGALFVIDLARMLEGADGDHCPEHRALCVAGMKQFRAALARPDAGCWVTAPFRDGRCRFRDPE